MLQSNYGHNRSFKLILKSPLHCRAHIMKNNLVTGGAFLLVQHCMCCGAGLLTGPC